MKFMRLHNWEHKLIKIYIMKTNSGELNDWKIFNAVSELYDTSGVSQTESFDPYSVVKARETDCRKKQYILLFQSLFMI